MFHKAVIFPTSPCKDHRVISINQVTSFDSKKYIFVQEPAEVLLQVQDYLAVAFICIFYSLVSLLSLQHILHFHSQIYKVFLFCEENQKIDMEKNSTLNYTMYTGHVLFKNMSVLQLSKTLNIFPQSFIIHWYASKTNIHNNTFLYLQKTVPFYLQLNSIYFFPAIKNYELIRSYNFYPSAKRMSLRQN